MGTADLRATFGDDRRHELNVSTYQMCVLLLFNDADRLCYRDIADATGVPDADLRRALQSLSLVKGRNVLRKEPATKDVGDADVFIFNDRFSSKMFKLKISTVAAQKEGEPERADTRHKARRAMRLDALTGLSPLPRLALSASPLFQPFPHNAIPQNHPKPSPTRLKT